MPVPIVKIHSESTLLGGAGNVVSNLNAFGANIHVISVLGDCDNSTILIKLLEDI